MPDTAFVMFEYGDGNNSTDQAFTIASAGGTQTFSYTYPSDGLNTVTVYIYNDASRVTKTIQVNIALS